jgi:hypothetical protein
MNFSKILLLLLLISAGCSSDSSVESQFYYDVKGLITKQIQLLSAQEKPLNKTVTVNAEVANTVLKDIQWNKELELFNQADINKSAYQKSYWADTTSLTQVYVLKDTEDLPVKTLRVVLDGQRRPSRVEATISNKNYLYESEKHLLMNLANGQLTSYEIEGFQQIVFGKRERFRVEAHL